jgi:hypothetical protein
MRRIFSLCLLGISTTVLVISCSKKNEATLQQPPGGGNNGNCDTVNRTYSLHVQPLLQNTCNSCHSTAQASGGVILDTYTGARAVAVNGKLVGAISHASGFRPMPQGGTKFSDCNINIIRSWVNRGALNN